MPFKVTALLHTPSAIFLVSAKQEAQALEKRANLPITHATYSAPLRTQECAVIGFFFFFCGVGEQHTLKKKNGGGGGKLVLGKLGSEGCTVVLLRLVRRAHLCKEKPYRPLS